MNRKLTGMALRLFSLLLLSLIFGNTTAVQGVAPIPRTPETPVRAPWSEQPRPSSPLDAGEQSLSLATPLKAVVFVGPIDGEDGDWTLSEIASARQTAAALRSHGVSVQEFYPNQANGTWSNIKAAAEGAHFLIYRGHGVYWSAMPTPIVGGFALKDAFVSNEMIRSELHPAKNFIVMLYGCFTAGSSGNDVSSISLSEAQRRVAMYSDPFFDIGAGGYYADWFGDAFTSYVNSLFANKTQGQAYEAFYDYNASMVWRGNHPDHSSLSMWLGWDNWYAPMPNYNNAFAGNPDATLGDLFDSRMVLSSTGITYLAETDYPARTYQVVVSSSSSTSLTWTVSGASLPPWLSLDGPSEGVSGQAFRFTVDPAQANGVKSAVLMVSTAAPNVSDTSQQVEIRLEIVDVVNTVYLPVSMK